MLKRERTRRNDVEFLETSQGYGQVCRYRYKHLLVTETLETMKAAIPTAGSRGQFASHSYSITLTWQNALTSMVVLSHLTERISLTNHR